MRPKFIFLKKMGRAALAAASLGLVVGLLLFTLAARQGALASGVMLEEITITGPSQAIYGEEVSYSIVTYQPYIPGGILYTAPDGFVVTRFDPPVSNPWDTSYRKVTVYGIHYTCGVKTHQVEMYDYYDLPTVYGQVQTTVFGCGTIKISGPGETQPGQETTYTISYKNLDPNLGILYKIPAGFSVTSASLPPSQQDGQTLFWTHNALPSHTGSITLTGKHGLCDTAIHTARFYDPASPDLPLQSSSVSTRMSRCPVTIAGAATGRQNEAMVYTIIYSAVPSGGAIKYTVPAGFSVTAADPPPDSQNGQLVWLQASLPPTGQITVTGAHANCGTIQHEAGLYDSAGNRLEYALAETKIICFPVECPDPNIWSVGSGSWDNSSNWNLDRLPGPGDTVLVWEQNTLVTPALVSVSGLCNVGELRSSAGQPLEVNASSFIVNAGKIQGEAGSAGNGGCGSQGSTILLSGGVPITNTGTIQAGSGGPGNTCGGAGGSVYVYGRNTHNSGTVCAGNGGSLLGTEAGQAGNGGETHLWGKWGGLGELVNTGTACAGDGGSSNPEALAPQTGGNGGSLKLISLPNVFLDGGQQLAGRGGWGAGGGAKGENGLVTIEPEGLISMKGPGTYIWGGNVEISGGNGWVLDLSNLSPASIIATENVTLSAGTGGVISLTGTTAGVIYAQQQIYVAADNVKVDAGKTLTNVLSAPSIVTETGKILRDVSVSMPEVLTLWRNATPYAVSLSVMNDSPVTDTFTLSIADTAHWLSGSLPKSVTIAGLDSQTFTIYLTVPRRVKDSALDYVTLKAVSQGDPTVSAVMRLEVHVKVVNLYMPLVYR